MKDLNRLRVFGAIGANRSLSRAADALGISKSNVSRKLAELEDELGVRLVQRTTRSVKLTPYGDILLEHWRRIEDELEFADARIQSSQAMPHGLLTVSAPVDFGVGFLAVLVEDFRRSYPLITLDLRLSNKKIDLVDEGIDVAFRIGDPRSQSLVVRKLCRSKLIVCASPIAFADIKKPSGPKDLKRHKLMIYPTDGTDGHEWLFHKDGSHEEVSIEPEIIANDFMTLLLIARSGMGLTAIPEMLARPLIAQGELVELMPDWHLAEHQINFVYPSRRLLSPKVRLFIDFTIQSFSPVAPWQAQSATDQPDLSSTPLMRESGGV